MKRNKKLKVISWITTMAMMISIFNIPLIGYATESIGESDVPAGISNEVAPQTAGEYEFGIYFGNQSGDPLEFDESNTSVEYYPEDHGEITIEHFGYDNIDYGSIEWDEESGEGVIKFSYDGVDYTVILLPESLFDGGDEGGDIDDYAPINISQVEATVDSDAKVVTFKFLAESALEVVRAAIEVHPLDCNWGYNYIESQEFTKGEPGENENEYYYEAKFKLNEEWDGDIEVLHLEVYNEMEDFFEGLQEPMTIKVEPKLVEGVKVASITPINDSVELTDTNVEDQVTYSVVFDGELNINEEEYDESNRIAAWFRDPDGSLIE
ncbi:MAG: hypothetical protein IKJ85_04070, partial [Firmicutes bacterium]|nr:hypothetical protein [Bacillota bacterium]